MTKVRVNGFTISLDGYGAGPDQDIDHPLGIGGHSRRARHRQSEPATLPAGIVL